MNLTLDLLVIAAYFAAIIGIGYYFSRRNDSMHDFALGGRSIPWWAVLASILAAEISAGTFFGTPGEGYALRNYTYAQLLFGYLLARIVVSAVFIPAYFRHNVVSIYEFLESRFGYRTRRAASGVFLVTRALASGSRLYVPTVLGVLAWNLMTGRTLQPMEEFTLCAVSLIFVSVFTALYTAMGGIKAVIWTDVLQIVVLFGALGFSLWYLLGHIPGGWEGAQSHLKEEHDLKFLAVTGETSGPGLWGTIKGILSSEYTIWAALLGSTFTTLATHGTDQDMVQRMLTAKNKKEAARATLLSGIADLPVVFAVLTIGILLYVFYEKIGTLPAALVNSLGKAESGKAFPYFVLTEMPGGLRGLVVAGVLATTMGSLGTALNSLATSYCRDFHFRWFQTPEAARVGVTRKATMLWALILIIVGLGTAWVKAMNPELRIIPIILGSFGYTYGSLLGIFLVGLFTTTRGSDRGNLIAMVCGFLFVGFISNLHTQLIHLVWPACPSLYPEFLPVVEFPWRIMFGTLVTFGVAMCFPSTHRMVEPPAEQV